jgi:FAD:protein FMN transferase
VTPVGTTASAAVLGTVRAMASDVTLYGPPDGARHADDPVVERALAVFPAVHAACTRFDPTSPLMRANARADEWHDVPPVLFYAVRAAHRAYLATDGRFDPRVLGDLVRLGYDRSLPFEDGGVATDGVVAARGAPRPWSPRFRTGPPLRLHLGGTPVDLGGIGKSLAVRWSAHILDEELNDYLLDAGGDCYCAGTGPEEDGWRVAVEDPAGADRPVAVLALRDAGCATSSTRLRRWRAGDSTAHHLIDPSTGRPGGAGLAAVTVVAPDTADAEVTAKDLFLRGADGIAAAADRGGVAALWVTTTGEVAASGAMAPHVVWWAS